MGQAFTSPSFAQLTSAFASEHNLCMLATSVTALTNHLLKQIQRVLTAIATLHPDLLARAIGLLYLNVWNQLVELVEPERLHVIVTAIVGSGQAAEKVIRLSDSDEIKMSLSQATLSAFEAGAFGLHWLIGESFYVLCRFVSRSRNDF